MFANKCLSAVGPGPCAILCKVCAAADERYQTEATRKAVADAVRLLQSHGYTVSRPADSWLNDVDRQGGSFTDAEVAASLTWR